MFEAMCDHLRYSINNGSLRSAITVFRQRTKPNHDFRYRWKLNCIFLIYTIFSLSYNLRVWNKQIINYAGYETEDGNVTGDKASVEFTKICQRLGWKGKGTEYDILPLVLQANGGEPEWFEIPNELILQININHPKYIIIEI